MSNQDWGQASDVIPETPLTHEELVALLCGFISYPTVFRSALRIGFEPSLFNGPNESALATFMALYQPMFEEHNHVTKNMFVTRFTGLLNAGLLLIGSADKEAILGDEGLAHLAFVGPPDNVDDAIAERHYTQGILRRFLNARLVSANLKNIFKAATSNAAPENLAELLETSKKQARAVAFVGNEAVNAATMPAPGSHIILPPPARPTTIAWIDNYIGGLRTGDVIGLLGPYAGGKTTMMSTVAVRMARQYAAQNENKLSVYICYEDGAQKMNWSFYSSAAAIHRDRFKNKNSSEAFWADLSTPGNLRAYERHIPANQNGEVMLSEYERWMAALPWLNQNFVFLDFSFSRESNYRGAGGVHEIVATLENLRDQRQMDIGAVFIDYAALMINRELSQNPRTRNQEQVWRQVGILPDELKTQIAVPFGASIFVAHQLAQGDIKNIPAYRHVSHADAQGSKSFGENVHACICLNKPDAETYVSTIHWSKIRFDRPVSPYGLVKIDENVVDVLQVDDDYYINEFSKKIMRRDEMAPVANTQSQRPTRNIVRMHDAGQPDIDADFLS
jgi:hypothetical protein